MSHFREPVRPHNKAASQSNWADCSILRPSRLSLKKNPAGRFYGICLRIDLDVFNDTIPVDVAAATAVAAAARTIDIFGRNILVLCH